MSERRRVVVTGLGVVSPLGTGVEEFWVGAVAGRSGIGRLRRVETEGIVCQIGGEVRDFDPLEFMDRKTSRRTARFSQFAIAAARQAWQQAGLEESPPLPERTGVIVGNGGGGLDLTELAVETRLREGSSRVDPLWYAKALPNMAAANVTMQLDARGYVNTVTTACAAGTQAIGDALEVIRRGQADVMVAGGAESAICATGVAGFATMRALTTRRYEDPAHASRPFDRDRDGFAPGEGAGLLVLESLDHARARGATVLAEVLGYGVTADASHLVAPAADGEDAARAITQALADGGVAPEEIDYVSAHATSTTIGDIAETRAIKLALGEHAYRTPISAMKSQIGHLLGGAGGVETVGAVQALISGEIPPTVNLEHPGDGCDLDYVPHEARRTPVRTVLKNAFAFGGMNAALVIRDADGL
jgi:3-oxoacyl-[acyl-carrier-protein] synthase II